MRKRKFKVTTEILIAAQCGNQKALTTIYEAFKGRFTDGMFGGRDDLYALMMAQVFQVIDTIDVNKPGAFYYYLVTAAQNTLKSDYKRNNSTKWKQRPTVEDYQEKVEEYQVPTPDDSNPMMDTIREVVEVINITPREKEIFLKYFFEGYNMREIGEEYGLTKERIRQINDKVTKKVKLFINKM